jgi:UPF0755 protein
MKKIFLILILIGAAIGAYSAYDLMKFGHTVTGSSADEKVIEIASGMNMTKLAKLLKEQGLVQNDVKLRLYAKIFGQGRHIKKGEYKLTGGMTPQAMLDVVASGKSIQYQITFPEGSNIYDMAQLLDQRGLIKGKDFLDLVRDPQVVQNSIGISAPSLEGYLFPETYDITRFTSAKELVRMMLSKFNNAYKELEKASPPSKLSRHEIVTLASVVEKETGAPEERPMIASIFYNRLAKGMPLQSDPTILYGIIDATGRPTNNITKADIMRPNRYNTYTVKKLPYGPIANPGREALAATLKPAQSEWLYFVSRNDGTHVFSKTYAEHLKAVKSFQLNPHAREGKSWRDLSKRQKPAGP